MFNSEQLADNVTIYCGDCREILPSIGRIDAVVSDPPYGIEDIVGGYGRGVHTIANDENLNAMIEVLNLIKQRNNDIWLALFYSCRISPSFFQATSMLEYFGEMIWDKKVMGLGSNIRYQHENIAFFKLGKPANPLKPTPSVLTFGALKVADENIAGQHKSSHPHEKPNKVMRNLCRIVTGKIILDPFMGTGSTGAAAVQNKRGFIGIELEPKYFDLARRKIGEALKQPVDFWEEE